MSEPEITLTSGWASETLHRRLQNLSEAIQRQLQEAERRHREQLESRIQHNTLLSADLNRLSPQTKLVESSSAALKSSPECNHLSSPPPTRTQHCQRGASSKTTQQMKEEEAEAECRKKFSALPVPVQVSRPLYREMMEHRDKERKRGLEQRKTFLLSLQKPFNFHQKEDKRQDKVDELLKRVSLEAKKTAANNVQKSSSKQVKAPTDNCRKIHVSVTQEEKHEKPKVRIAERTRMEKLGFLYEKPSFRPKINRQVPDFSHLHKTLHTDARRASLTQETTKCQPFYLRTSALPARESKPTPEKSQISSQSNLARSKSCSALKSLSADTLPIYITDATRKRCMAIRTTMEIRDGKNKESADWSRKYHSKSEAMKKMVSHHAKLLDPHKSLKRSMMKDCSTIRRRIDRGREIT
ncbi:protein FAM161B [Syngnathoides biaculeatus]|uniref:protein FAM161B n=1 Tax=Syngnathoides biaculeatus TaxID=300417 RepID=UPI002ADD8281|nr:protein FAM161B [Syngnathoides biaculeatus]